MVTEPSATKPTVLVVEDEMLLRMRAVDIVEDAGFTPLEAVNAEDALVLLESRSDIDLLFTDIQLPGAMNGLKLAYAVHERWPSIKIILVSGQVTPGETDRPAHSRFYAKPIEVQHMIAELQDMIGRGFAGDHSDQYRRAPKRRRYQRGGESNRGQPPAGIDSGKRQPSRLAGAGQP
jgi:DNA-binding NtrC family response regulator